MEKYSQFRDKGSGVAPFLPINSKSTGIYLPLNIFIFIIKLPFILVAATYFLLLQWLPLNPFFKKLFLWLILGIPGLWWIDLQIDGVRKGSLAKKHADRVPGPSDVIVSSFASPIDALYLAAIFDPIFTISYPHTEKVQVISLFSAIFRALAKPEEYPLKSAKLTDIKTLILNNQQRIVVVFPECTTTNGLGIMPFSPSLLMVPKNIKIFPVHLRYSPSDITTPIPGLHLSFLWNLLALPTHCIRVRIARPVFNISPETFPNEQYSTNSSETSLRNATGVKGIETTSNYTGQPYKANSAETKNILDAVGEALARLGRVPRVGLTVSDKIKFIKAWKSK